MFYPSYFENVIPTDPGTITIINVQTEDKSALVSWTVKSQEACSGVVVNYTVFYTTENGTQLSKSTTDLKFEIEWRHYLSRHSCPGFLLDVTVDGTQQKIFLKDLKPKTQYSVYVTATALTGTTKSNEWSIITKRFGE